MPFGHFYFFFGERSILAVSPFFNWVAYFFVVELNDLSVYFGNEALLVCLVCKYLFILSVVFSVLCFSGFLC